ncbi:conserved hypothetical protein [methanotrophic bacterial endosymbiont of Bathymodiolus sp.]|nr:conserved hypothetical protein [methanotrophic bacterial endosymbiont of Bathymodiolus sp.]
MGKTELEEPVQGLCWKHPHGRGEDHLHLIEVCLIGETPPRAWGRLLEYLFNNSKEGNTPTGVGKTLQSPCPTSMEWKHPHGRGEDLKCQPYAYRHPETPPRAWGRLA